MYRHKHAIRVLLAVVTTAVLASCAYSPRVIEENDAVLSIRTDYLRSNPTGKFNDFIKRGEVVKGMNYVEVLASWGFPEARLRVADRGLEYWRYVTRDDASRDWVQYTFVFEGNALAEWEMMRHNSKTRAMAQIEFRDATGIPTEEMYPPESSAALRK
jgi:hypothetical protein